MTDRLEEIRKRCDAFDKSKWEQTLFNGNVIDVFDSEDSPLLKQTLGEDIPYLLSEIDRLQAENALKNKALELACEAVESWGAYAGEYFQEKHGLVDDCKPEYQLQQARYLLNKAKEVKA